MSNTPGALEIVLLDAQEGHADDERKLAAFDDLLAALRDMLSGWQYIRRTHGDLYGVGWDRCEASASAAITKAEAK